MQTKEELDKQIQDTEKKLHALKGKETKVKRTSIILSHGSKIGSISLFDDLKTIFILGKEKYTGEGEKAYWYACGYAANLGHKIKPITVD